MGYLAYSLLARLSGGRVDGPLLAAVGLGTQFPDVVDKVLWWGGLLPAGRSLAHSLFVAVPLSLLAVRLAARRGRPAAGTAFAVGYLTHLPGDAVSVLARGSVRQVGFLLWPLTPVTPGRGTAVARMFDVLGSPAAYLSSGYRSLFVLVVVLVWVADGLPGVAGLGRSLGRAVRGWRGR